MQHHGFAMSDVPHRSTPKIPESLHARDPGGTTSRIAYTHVRSGCGAASAGGPPVRTNCDSRRLRQWVLFRGNACCRSCSDPKSDGWLAGHMGRVRVMTSGMQHLRVSPLVMGYNG